MSYAIVGFGAVGQALARTFVRRNIDVTVASRRSPEALAPQARAIGPRVIAKSLRDALAPRALVPTPRNGQNASAPAALSSAGRFGSGFVSRRPASDTNHLNSGKNFGGKGGTRTLDPGIMSADPRSITQLSTTTAGRNLLSFMV